MPGAKKEKKNGKDGGVVAAVTKHAAGKFSNNGNINKPPTPESSSPSSQSPALRPTRIPSNGNPSPLLEATSFTPSTNEWMKGVPGLGSSPGNLINLMGESPPTQPSSYEDPRGMLHGWPSPRPYHNNQHASASPPNSSRRPLSFHMDNHYSPSEAYTPSAASIRRSSMHSRAGYNPPLPHQPQAHFYGTPEIDLDYGQQTGIKAGERGFAFGFDTIPGLNSEGACGKDTVVLTGYEGGLEVHSATRKGVEPIGSLKGLRGGVYYAKILPWTCAGEESDLGLLVAVVLHGPVLPKQSLGLNAESDLHNTRNGSGTSSPANTEFAQRDGMGARPNHVDSYQTSVEVYSLKDSRCVRVLLEGPPIPLKTSIDSPIFQAPPPSGTFRILADSGTIVVSSGQTGESWVYRHARMPHEPGLDFRCVAKLWTTIQQPLPDPSQDLERVRLPVQRQAARAPIIALKGRWIAYCPAAPSSQVSLRAMVTVPVQGKAPGYTSLTPPHLPSVISDVDLPGSDSVMNRFMRETTQELILGAKWVGERGLQAFSNYWNRSATPTQQARSPPPSSSWNNPYSPRPEAPQFPPTHGTMAPAVSKEPGLVSILDVDTSLNLASIYPVTTFATSGCSFLSFAPNGLSLFTASSKGDVQTVWDLMRIQYTKSTPLQASAFLNTPSGPRVRQIAQFSRMTVARIVDVSWMKPMGESIAMVTERGTVHLLDMPPSAFTWPPPRRRLAVKDPANVPDGGGTAVSMAAGALTSALDVARPLITRPRRSSSNAQTTGSRFVEHANYGGKMIAAGISHSLGKTGSAINQLRHNGDNRIALPTSSMAPGPSCVILVAGRKDHSLYVLGDGLVRLYPQRSRRSLSAAGRLRAPRFISHKDFKLPILPDDLIAKSVEDYMKGEENFGDPMNEESDGVNNTMVLNARPKLSHHKFNVESSIPQAEIESSAPYQPFHTDKRVALHEYSLEQAEVAVLNQLSLVSVLLADTHLDGNTAHTSSRRKQKANTVAKSSENTGAWAFGQPIEATRLDYSHLESTEEELFNMSAEDSRALPQSAMERSIAQHDDEQIVITTRRRRGGVRNGDLDDDGFFEDDCEVLDFADQRV